MLDKTLQNFTRQFLLGEIVKYNIIVVKISFNNPKKCIICFIYDTLQKINPNFTSYNIIKENINIVYNITFHNNILNLTDYLCMIGAQHTNIGWSYLSKNNNL